MFVVVQFFLSQEVTGKDTALSASTRRSRSSPTCCRWRRPARSSLEEQLAQLRANLAGAEGERDQLQGPSTRRRRRRRAAAQGKVSELTEPARQREAASPPRALAQVEILNQQIAALRRQLAALEEALDASEKKRQGRAGAASPISASASTSRWRSGCRNCRATAPTSSAGCAQILGNRPDIRIVGDRFVFQSEVFFDTGQAVLQPEGRAELDKLAAALLELEKQIPSEIAWVLRVDGHTDVRPIASRAVPVELGAVGGARHLGGAVSDQQGRVAAAPGRRRLRRIPADRHRTRPRKPTAATAASS